MNKQRIRGRTLFSLIAAAALIVCLLAALGTHSLAEEVSETQTRIGDVNGDGDIDMKDVLALRRYIAPPDEPTVSAAADCNGDGAVDMKDVLRLRRFLAHLETHLGGEPTGESSEPETSTEPTTGPTTGTTNIAFYTWPTKTPIDSESPRINFIRGSDRTLGVWWWRTSEGTDVTVRDQYFDFLEENQVTEIYYYGANRLSSESARQTVHTFVQAAMTHGLRVAVLFDNQAVVKAGNTSFTGVAEQYLRYRAEYPDDALYGIHCDIEPQADARVSREATAAWVQNYTDNFLIAQVAPARAQGVCVELDIATGWWRYGKEVVYSGSPTHEYDGQVMNFDYILAYNCDCMCIMSYRDTAKEVYAMAESQRIAANAAGTKIVYGVETGDDGEGDHVDFSAESKEILYAELSSLFVRLEIEPPVGGGGFAIHHMQTWYRLRDTM